MVFHSTRDTSVTVTAAQAIVKGLAPDGGLYVPTTFPQVDKATRKRWGILPYAARAAEILRLFLEDFPSLGTMTEKAYGRFAHPEVAPVRKLGDSVYLLELFHGPTCAFKDVALQILPHLLKSAFSQAGGEGSIGILTATSGDTGKAALEGFRDMDGVSVLVFYPQNGVSPMQELQMVTQEGANVSVCAVEGNFDDTQNGVKALFQNPDFFLQAEKKGIFLTSANSINLGRLLPQIVYYFSAHADLVNTGALPDENASLDVCVPTGNFGNILAAFYAKQMGLPIRRLVCASNRNRILTDFLKTGVYDVKREFYTTLSPSMDILVSSNLERLLFHLSGDAGQVRAWMEGRDSDGVFSLPHSLLAEVQKTFVAGFCDEEDTKREIRRVWDETGVLIDPHTAVAHKVAREYQDGPMLMAATASPFKFPEAMRDALGLPPDVDLAAVTGKPCPVPLLGLGDKPVRFTETAQKDGMEQAARNFFFE